MASAFSPTSGSSTGWFMSAVRGSWAMMSCFPGSLVCLTDLIKPRVPEVHNPRDSGRCAGFSALPPGAHLTLDPGDGRRGQGVAQIQLRPVLQGGAVQAVQNVTPVDGALG